MERASIIQDFRISFANPKNAVLTFIPFPVGRDGSVLGHWIHRRGFHIKIGSDRHCD
jgi:hypothetical protein